MAKLYFTYGTMGSSKTAQALMLRFSYLERGKKVLFLKPSVDNRDGKDIIRSRIKGLEAPVSTFNPEDSIINLFKDELLEIACVIVDEVNFATKEQINELKEIAMNVDVPVYSFGLRTDFQTNLFTGSKRMFEIADTISEIKSPCHCGNKTIVNARFENNKVVYEGDSIVIGGDEKYKALCYTCWQKGLLK